MEAEAEKPIDNSLDNEGEVKISTVEVTTNENIDKNEGIKDSDIIVEYQGTMNLTSVFDFSFFLSFLVCN